VARPAILSREDFLNAGLMIIDSEGLDALTFRHLGETMGVSHTAAHSHFANRGDLLNAITHRLVASMLNDIDLSDTTPRGLIKAIAIATRSTLAKHPRLIPVFLLLDSDSFAGQAEVLAVVSALESAGTPKDEIALAYRTIENYVFGATIFDFGSAPQHLAIRKRRYVALGHPEFAKVSGSDEAVGRHNDEAFVFGLDRLLDGLGL